MANVRLNNEKKIDSEYFKLKIGTTNKLEPMIIYIEGRTFICPQKDKDDYSKDISELKTGLKRKLSQLLSGTELFDDKFIMDFQIASKGIIKDKKSFLFFQILLRQKKDNILKLKDVKDKSKDFIDELVNHFAQNIMEHNFEITKIKK